MIATNTISSFGHDINGNPIAHWSLFIDGEKVAGTKKRRVQCGYSNYRDDPAVVWFNENGYLFERINSIGSRSENHISIEYIIV